MFLAEDRILGFGIVTASEQNWRLAHLSSVVTVTDSCQSLSELLRQRRRWINGSLACRLWTLTQLPNYLYNTRANFASKSRLLRAVPLYILRSFTDWFNPALSLIVWTLIFSSTQSLLTQLSWPTALLNLAFAFSLLLIACQLILCIVNKFNQVFWVIIISYISLFLMTLLSLWIWVKPYLLLFIIGFILCTLLGITKIHSSWLASKFWQYIPFYILIDSTVTLMLKTYSFCNINDCSWGTKGLVKEQQNISVKKIYLSLWLASNALLLVLACQFHLSVFFLIVAFLDFFLGIISGSLMAFLISIKSKINIINS